MKFALAQAKAPVKLKRKKLLEIIWLAGKFISLTFVEKNNRKTCWLKKNKLYKNKNKN